MNVLKEDEFERKFAERYNDNPIGWRCFYTIDKEGKFSMGFVNRRIGEQYWLRLSSPYSSHYLGFIGTLDEDFPFLSDPFYDKDFGVRYFNLTSEERESLFKKGWIVSSLTKKIERAKKSPPESEKDGKEAEIIYPIPRREINSLKDLSPAQRELEIKMQEEIKRFNKQRLSGYVS